MSRILVLNQLFDRQNKWSYWGGSFLFWTAIAAVFTTQTNIYYSLKGTSTSWIHLSIHHVASAWTWLLLTPLIYKLYRVLVSRLKNSIALTFSLLVIAPIIGLIHSVSSLALDTGFRRYMNYIEGTVWENLVLMDSIVISRVFDSSAVFLLITAFFYGLSRANDKTRMDSTQSRIKVKDNGRLLFLDPKEIIAVSAEGNYIKIYTSTEKPVMVRQTMSGFQSMLDDADVVRINRSFIVNLTHVKSLRHKFNGEYTLTLSNELEVNTSKHFSDAWKKLLG